MIEVIGRFDGEVLLRAETLRNANLSGMDLTAADLHGLDLRGANLDDTRLYGADFTGANLQGASLRRADLCEAILSNVDLRDADLDEADLLDAILENADVRGAYIPDIGAASIRGTLVEDDSIASGGAGTVPPVSEIGASVPRAGEYQVGIAPNVAGHWIECFNRGSEALAHAEYAQARAQFEIALSRGGWIQAGRTVPPVLLFEFGRACLGLQMVTAAETALRYAVRTWSTSSMMTTYDAQGNPGPELYGPIPDYKAMTGAAQLLILLLRTVGREHEARTVFDEAMATLDKGGELAGVLADSTPTFMDEIRACKTELLNAFQTA